jgi:hypothetical protein
MKRKIRRPRPASPRALAGTPAVTQDNVVNTPAEPTGHGDAGGTTQRISGKEIADIVTQAWRARVKMIDPASREVREDMKRIIRHVEAILSSCAAMGFELKDHTGDGFDYGLPLRVVGTQPTSGLARETVLETLKPTIYWRNHIIQQGEVIVGTPVEP